ncbi:MAG: hypothetical protein Kow0065_21740 [Methylomicrobium sp.]
MSESSVNFDQVRDACRGLTDSFDSVLMATVGEDGKPEASYAAYVKHEGDYYVYISELAAHTRNLSANGNVSLLFIEDESDASHLFARQRVTFQGLAEEVERDSEPFKQVMNLFQQKFGQFIEMLKKMEDFHLFRIHPTKGSFVQGFARAFTIQGEALNEFRHVNDTGHRSGARGSESESRPTH